MILYSSSKPATLFRRDRWPGEYVVEDANGQEHAVYWETVLHLNLPEALSKIAASRARSDL
jgi:hypothetical protein